MCFKQHGFLDIALLGDSGGNRDKLAPGKTGDGTGVVGNPARSTVEYGRRIVEMQIDAATRQIRALRESSRR